MDIVYDINMNDVTELSLSHDNPDKITENDLIVFANGVRIPFLNKTKKIIINVNDINRCSVCNKIIDNKIIKNSIKNATHIDNTIENTLLEIEIETVHKQCKRLKTKYNKLRDQLASIDFQIFCLEK